jgi:hypothetical protein
MDGGSPVCFSPEADVLAGLVVGAVGIDALRHVRRPAEFPLAVLPLVFGCHQLIESFVWWGLEGRVPTGVWHPAVWLYVAIAFGVLPVLVPVAIGALEPVTNRRRLGVLTAIGVAVAAVLMYAVVRGPVEAAIEGHHIVYRLDIWHGYIITACYVLVTCGSTLVSQHKHVRRYGAINLVVVCLLAWLSLSSFISLWCVWAAATSLAIAVHLRYSAPPPRPGLLSEASATERWLS